MAKAGGPTDTALYGAGDDATGTTDRDLDDPEVAEILDGAL